MAYAQRKKRVTLWVHPTEAQRLEQLAKVSGTTLSQMGAELLTRALADGDTLYAAQAQRAIEGVIREEIQSFSERYAHLLARTALEAATTRRMLLNDLSSRVGSEAALSLNERSWQGSVESLKKPSEGVRSLLEGNRS